MIYCTNHGFDHWHQSQHERLVCISRLVATKEPPSPMPYTHGSSFSAEPMVTQRQLEYIHDLGGDRGRASTMTRREASAYIDNLRSGTATRSGAPVNEKKTTDPRLDMVKSFLEIIPDGYYAVRRDDASKLTFMRIATVKPNTRSRFAGARKIQTQHGPTLENALVLWPSGNWSVFDSRAIEPLMLLVADHHTAGLAYAKELKKCMRCTTSLTDERSRYYGIGPECEHKPGYEWVIPTVDAARTEAR